MIQSPILEWRGELDTYEVQLVPQSFILYIPRGIRRKKRDRLCEVVRMGKIYRCKAISGCCE